MKLSPRLIAEREFVEKQLGDRVICGRCQATLRDYSVVCSAELSEPCPGFQMIEAAKQRFKENPCENLKS